MYYSDTSQTLVRAHKLFTEQLHPNHISGALNAPTSTTYTPLIQIESTEIAAAAALLCISDYRCKPLKSLI